MNEKRELQVDIHQLWTEYQQHRLPDIREKIVAHYLSLVKLVAGRIAIGLPTYVDKDDLISNGFFGLLDAIERFDPNRNIKFETYAVARIRGAILDSLRALDWVPTTVRQRARQYEQVLGELEHKLGRSATDDEIAEAIGISVAQLHTLLNQLNASTIMPLEEFVKTETPSKQLATPLQYVEDEDVKRTLCQAINKLPDKERLVIALYYYESLTLKEISIIMKLTEARISQLHTKAIFRLRGALARVKSSLL
ncbi:FliA/WhiG family RNA polymerase sigma factor [Acetonema longum]|uniref:RNA polymerase sigma factor n=1 Tax=Acetonema longum DSM 6540 TaxID=1009370 RepID=F7NL71_9FIRM|nr:FliA/WhiG family RNA polymerase sigma factor [Acetonema longum]EGO63176.1 RNA polymerase sigma factor, flia/whig family protein [Acetonema longum DSM 6540]